MARPPIEIARDSLNKALGKNNAIASQAHSLDSIAASLLVIARHLEAKEDPQITEDQVELMIRRFLDNIKESPKKGKK
jgi:hypothetical protein